MRAIPQVARCLVLLAGATACVACSSESTPTQTSERGPQRAGLVFSFSMAERDEGLAGAVADDLTSRVQALGLPAVTRLAEIVCPQDGASHETRACYDIRMYVPNVPERLAATAQYAYHSGELLQTFYDEDLVTKITHAETKGFAWGGGVAILFSLRQMLDQKPEGSSSLSDPLLSSSSSSPTSSSSSLRDAPSEHVTVSGLEWNNSTKAVTKDDGVELEVFAPGFDGTDGSSGTWALYGYGARVKNGDLKCLRGAFVDLNTGDKQTVDAGDCSNIEKYVELDSGLVATAVSMKVSDNDIKGVGLGEGTPQTTVDVINPDFLTGVGPDNFEYDGSTGTYAPDTSELDDSYPYVIVGIGAGCSSSKVKELVAYQGYLTAPAPLPTTTWEGYTVEEIEADTLVALNAVWAGVVSEAEFDLYPDCVSTIPDIKFCENLEATESYSTTELDSTCSGVCDASYQTCKAAKDTCDIACCTGCSTGSWCSCKYHCNDEDDDCYDGCTDTFTGSVELNIKNIKDLNNLEFTDVYIPFLPEGATLSATVSAQVKGGLTANVYWELCQSGICDSDTSPLESETWTITATVLITAVPCGDGTNVALYVSLEDVDTGGGADWNINEFVDEVLAGIDESMDWLADNISDVFSADLDDDYQSLNTEITEGLDAALDDYQDIPVTYCPKP
jgi:hypothetical protein